MADAKLQRWIDLVGALLSRHFGATFDTLRAEVPAYNQGQDPDTLMRMFERDKDELRAYGIPIEMVGNPDGGEYKYRVDPREMYLPYISLVSSQHQPVKVNRDGYRGLRTLSFEPDQISTLLEGANVAIAMGDPLLESDARSAVRKLTFDLRTDVGLAESGDAPVSPVRQQKGALRALGEALLRRKFVTFGYHAMHSDSETRRTVDPYGLFYHSGQWYLAGFDRNRGALRNFRVSRMQGVAMNKKKPTEFDYVVPKDFRLKDHAESRHAWEIGDGEAEEMVIEICGESGATMALSRLGHAVEGSERQRSFQVRRADAFTRWLLSFAGEAKPISPPQLIADFNEAVSLTRARYGAAHAS
ncbi:MAG: hypothetical protein JWO05_3857 [Gemmatimonadetes bacterium]|nr:hypothetical protein [Gemmatimonadota bacterium]